MARRVVFPRLWLVKESKSSHHFECGVLTSLPVFVFVVVAVVFDFVLVVIVYFSYFLLLSEHKRGEVGLEYQCFCLFIESTEFLLLLLWFVWVSVCVCACDNGGVFVSYVCVVVAGDFVAFVPFAPMVLC